MEMTVLVPRWEMKIQASMSLAHNQKEHRMDRYSSMNFVVAHQPNKPLHKQESKTS